MNRVPDMMEFIFQWEILAKKKKKKFDKYINRLTNI